MRLLGNCILLAATALAWCGCSTPSREDPFAQRAAPVAAPRFAAAPVVPRPPGATGRQVAPFSPQETAPSGPSAGDAEALAAVVAEFGELDEQAKARLVSDLRQTDPRLWPRLLDSFRAAMQFRRQSEDRSFPAARHDLALQPGEQLTGRRSELAEHAFRPSAPDSRDTRAWQQRTRDVTRNGFADDGQPSNRLGALSSHTIDGNRPNVSLASFERDSPANWRRQLSDVTGQLESTAATADESVAREVYLRLLYLAAGRRDDAMRKISSISPEQQEFWAAELYAIGTWLDAEQWTIEQQRAEEALVHFDNARSHLAAVAALHVSNMHFCTDVSSYGIFDSFEANQFRPNQEVILYAEIDNFMSRYKVDKGYHTAIQGKYQIFDSRGQRAAEGEFQLMTEHCHNPRRDYFVAYRLKIPNRLYDGEYTLQLTVEDTLAKKIGQSTVQFTVKH